MPSRHGINKASSGTVNELPLADALGSNEIDSLADTSCAGWNWIPLLFTGNTVNVLGHSGAQQDSAVPLATCGKKIVTESCTPCILMCPQMLWFVSRCLVQGGTEDRMSSTAAVRVLILCRIERG